METTLIMKLGDNLLFTFFQFGFHSHFWTLIMNHSSFKLGHLKQEFIVAVIHNISVLMTIHINSFFNKCVLPSQLNQPLLSSLDSKGFFGLMLSSGKSHC